MTGQELRARRRLWVLGIVALGIAIVLSVLALAGMRPT